MKQQHLINQRERVRQIKLVRPPRLKCEVHKYHAKKKKSQDKK
ncbi:MAG: hypothetical protein QG648_127 [Patescibacteria group bacterium]|nr:hypothetical protein [Patescibacteria group bacterium]